MKYYLSISSLIRNEALNIKEWIDYHLGIGVEHFYLIDNASTDNTVEILQPYIDKNIVTLKQSDNAMSEWREYLTEDRKQHKDETFWMFCSDVDEFLVPMSDKSVVEVLKDFEEYGALGINWLIYGSSGHIKRPEDGVLKNYLYRSEFNFEKNLHIKCIINPRVTGLPYGHNFAYQDGFYCVDENKEKIDGSFTEKYSGNLLRINHYYCKSKEDYKIKTERATELHKSLNIYNNDAFDFHDRNEIFDDILKDR